MAFSSITSIDNALSTWVPVNHRPNVIRVFALSSVLLHSYPLRGSSFPQVIRDITKRQGLLEVQLVCYDTTVDG
jgi:hypothetical protein